MKHHSLFSDKAEIYARARPTYPSAVYDHLSQLCEKKEVAWDCACGNGQSAVDLAKWFSTVEATDVSKEQISNAIACPNVNYSVATAEATGFPDDYFDLVCVAQALHWFDYDVFWVELSRVMKPGAIFAAWGYSWFKVGPQIDLHIEKTILSVIRSFWAPQNKLLWDHYRDVPFPLKKLQTPKVTMSMLWSLDELYAYLHTWSATRRCMDEVGDDFFVNSFQRAKDLWGNPEHSRQVEMDFCFLIGKNEI